MIEVIFRRNNGIECAPVTRNQSPQEALFSMVKFELGYGGMIVEASETSLTVQTRVLNCVDRTTFSGSKEDMRILTDTAYYFLQACKHDHTSIDQVVKHLGETSKGLRAFYLVNLAPMLLGQKRVQIAYMLGMGLSNAEDIEFGSKLRFDDLFALLGLITDSPGRTLQKLALELGVTDSAVVAA